jgi:moderate conductance mechanosensitive channel
VIRYIAAAVVVVVAVLLVLGELGVAITPLLATAGVAGVALGFGAQALVKDFLNGFFLLLEDQIRQGDVVEIAGKGGLVEEVTLRYVRLRDYEGAVHFIPAGSITSVTNRSRGYAYAVIDLHLEYRVDADTIFGLLREEARAMREDPGFGPRILEDLEIAGVDALDAARITVKCRIKVRSLEQWDVRREFLRRVKSRFEAESIDLPLPQFALYRGGRFAEMRRPAATAQPQVGSPVKS